MSGVAQERLAALAARQEGVVSAEQCRECGVSKFLVSTRVKQGAWQRLFPGVYQLGVGPCTSSQQEVAALLVVGPEGLLSHLTAARRLGLDVPPLSRVQLTVPWTQHASRAPGLEVFRSRDLMPADVQVRGAVRLTKLARTMLDLAAVLDEGWLRAAVDSAVRQRRTNLGWMTRVAGERGAGHAGAARLSRLLERYDGHGDVPDSALEALARRLFEALSPRPALHFRVVTPKLSTEVDFAWPRARLCVELDSFRFHGQRDAFREDRARDRALSAAGWSVLRFTWEDVADAPDAVAAEVARALDARGQAALKTGMPPGSVGSWGRLPRGERR